MKPIRSIALVYSLTLLAAGHSPLCAQTTRAAFNVVIRAIDDAGAAVPGANIGFSWGTIGMPKPDADYSRKNADSNGEARFEGQTISSSYAYGATRDGYYPVRGLNGTFEEQKNGRWLPWEARLDVLLKRIKHPTPMYAKRIDVLIPEVGKPVGYDLQKGDWVAPYGTGLVGDLEFTVAGQYESKQNYRGELTVRAAGAGNGIFAQEMDHASRLKMPYEAPEVGYIERVTWQNRRETKNGSQSVFSNEPKPSVGFIFRVRAVVDPQGRILQADYGKIHGPVFFQTFENGQSRIGFSYYYNPDHTRNLEFDPKLNLLVNIKTDESVVDP